MNILLDFFSDLKPETISLLLIPFSFIKGYTIMLLSTYILQINTTIRRKARFIYLYALFSYIFVLGFRPPFYIIANLVIITLLLTHIYRINLLKGLFYQVIHAPLSLSIQLLLTKIFISNQSICVHTLRATPGYFLLIEFCIYFSLFFVYHIFKHTALNTSYLNSLSKSEGKQLFFYFLYNIVFFLAIYLVVYYYIATIPLPLVIVVFISFLHFLTTLVSSINVKAILLSLNVRLQQTQLYTENLESLQDNLRAFKHDFSNIMQSIGGYTSLNDINGLKAYYKDIKKDCNEINSLSTLNPAIVNNPALYNLITTKYNLAKTYKIDFNIEVFIDLNALSFPIYKITRILGILLDNAIESAKESNDKVINLRIYNKPKMSKQVIIVENTYNKSKSINIDKIFEKGYSTKENNTGLGLWEIQNTVKKNNNLNLYTHIEDDYFIQEFEISTPQI